jgi:hypothetical protein
MKAVEKAHGRTRGREKEVAGEKGEEEVKSAE